MQTRHDRLLSSAAETRVRGLRCLLILGGGQNLLPVCHVCVVLPRQGDLWILRRVQWVIELNPLGVHLRSPSRRLTDAVGVVPQNVVDLENASPRGPKLLVGTGWIIAVVDKDLVTDPKLPLFRELIVLSFRNDLGFEVILVHDIMREQEKPELVGNIGFGIAATLSIR